MFFKLHTQSNGVIRLKYLSKPQSMDEFEVYLAALKDLYVPQKKFSLLIDTRDLPGILSWKYLKRQADFMVESEPMARKYIHRMALVVTSPLIKSLIQTIFLLKAPVTVTETFHDDTFAEKWAVTQLPIRFGDAPVLPQPPKKQQTDHHANSRVPREAPKKSLP